MDGSAENMLSIISTEFGPECTTECKGRHQLAIRRIIDSLEPRIYGPEVRNVIIGLNIGGRYEQGSYARPILSKPRRSQVLRDGYVCMELGISSSDLRMSDGEYRELMVGLISEGLTRLLRTIKRRGLECDEEALRDDFARVLHAYQQLPLPLPPSPDEATTKLALSLIEDFKTREAPTSADGE